MMLGQGLLLSIKETIKLVDQVKEVFLVMEILFCFCTGKSNMIVVAAREMEILREKNTK